MQYIPVWSMLQATRPGGEYWEDRKQQQLRCHRLTPKDVAQKDFHIDWGPDKSPLGDTSKDP